MEAYSPDYFRAPKMKTPLSVRLFILFAVYTALPFVEIPVVGLSLSAPLFYVLFLEVFLKARQKRRLGVKGWAGLAMLIGTGLFMSSIVNGFSSEGMNFGKSEAGILFYYFYWLFVFFTTVYLLALKPRVLPMTANMLAAAIVFLAVIRLYEAVVYGSVGAWTKLYFMPQNQYAWLFSSYSIFLAGPLFEAGKKHKFLTLLGMILVLGAVIVNGSRSSWISMIAAVLVFGLIYLAAHPEKGRGIAKLVVFLILLAVFFFGLLRFAPERVRESFMSRFSTFENLEEDKSYQIRKLMVKKAQIILKQSPVWGCGPGRFRATHIELELPRALRYGSEEHFNAKSSHNSYMQFFAETGMAGGVPFVMLLLALFWKGFKAAVYLTREKQFWAAALYASFISMSIHLWSLAGLTGTAPWLKYGMVAAMILIARRVRIEKIMAARQAAEAARSDS